VRRCAATGPPGVLTIPDRRHDYTVENPPDPKRLAAHDVPADLQGDQLRGPVVGDDTRIGGRVLAGRMARTSFGYPEPVTRYRHRCAIVVRG